MPDSVPDRVVRALRRKPVGAVVAAIGFALVALRGLLGPDRYIGFASDWSLPLGRDGIRAWATDFSEGWSPLDLGSFISYNTDLGLRFWIGALEWLGLDGRAVGQLVLLSMIAGAALTAAWLARDLGAGRLPAVVCGLVVAGSGLAFNATVYGYLTLLAALVALPVVLLGVTRASRCRGYSAAWACLLSAAAVVLVAHAQLVVLGPLAGLAAVLAVPRLERAPWRRIAARLTVPIAVTALSQAAVWVPNLLLSRRAGDIVASRSGAHFEGSYLGVWDALNGRWSTPDFYAERARELGVGGLSLAVAAGAVVVVLLAQLLLRDTRRAPVARLGALLVLAGLLVACAGTPPFSIGAPLTAGPLGTALRNISNALILPALGMALLAAALIDSLARFRPVAAAGARRMAAAAAGPAAAVVVVLVAVGPWLDGRLGGALVPPRPDMSAYRALDGLALRDSGRVLGIPLFQPGVAYGEAEYPSWGWDGTKTPREVPAAPAEDVSGWQLALLQSSAYEDPPLFGSTLERLRIGTVVGDGALVSHWSDLAYACRSDVLETRQAQASAQVADPVPGLGPGRRIRQVTVHRTPLSGSFAGLNRAPVVWTGPLLTPGAGLGGEVTLSDRDLPGAVLATGARGWDRMIDLVPPDRLVRDGRADRETTVSACDDWVPTGTGLIQWWDASRAARLTTLTTFSTQPLPVRFSARAGGRHHLLVELASSPRGSSLLAAVDRRADGTAPASTVLDTRTPVGGGMTLRSWSFEVGPGSHTLTLVPEGAPGTGSPESGENVVGRIAVLSDAELAELRRAYRARARRGVAQIVAPAPPGGVDVDVPVAGTFRLMSRTGAGPLLVGGSRVEIGAAVTLGAGRHRIAPASPPRLAGRRTGEPASGPVLPGRSSEAPRSVAVEGLSPGRVYRVAARACAARGEAAPTIRVRASDGFPIASEPLGAAGCDGPLASWSGTPFRVWRSSLTVDVYGGQGRLLDVGVEEVEGGLPYDLRLEPAAEPLGGGRISIEGPRGPTEDAALARYRLTRPAASVEPVVAVLPVAFDERWQLRLFDADGDALSPRTTRRFVADGYANGWEVTLAPGDRLGAFEFTHSDRGVMRLLVVVSIWTAPVLLLAALVLALRSRVVIGRGARLPGSSPPGSRGP